MSLNKHLIVRAGDPAPEASGEVEAGAEDDLRWDWYGRWIEPWLWTLAYTWAVDVPYLMFKWAGYNGFNYLASAVTNDHW